MRVDKCECLIKWMEGEIQMFICWGSEGEIRNVFDDIWEVSMSEMEDDSGVCNGKFSR